MRKILSKLRDLLSFCDLPPEYGQRGHEALGWLPGQEGVIQAGYPVVGNFNYPGTQGECPCCRAGKIHPTGA